MQSAREKHFTASSFCSKNQIALFCFLFSLINPKETEYITLILHLLRKLSSGLALRIISSFFCFAFGASSFLRYSLLCSSPLCYSSPLLFFSFAILPLPILFIPLLIVDIPLRVTYFAASRTRSWPHVRDNPGASGCTWPRRSCRLRKRQAPPTRGAAREVFARSSSALEDRSLGPPMRRSGGPRRRPVGPFARLRTCRRLRIPHPHWLQIKSIFVLDSNRNVV